MHFSRSIATGALGISLLAGCSSEQSPKRDLDDTSSNNVLPVPLSPAELQRMMLAAEARLIILKTPDQSLSAALEGRFGKDCYHINCDRLKVKRNGVEVSITTFKSVYAPVIQTEIEDIEAKLLLIRREWNQSAVSRSTTGSR